LLKDEYKNYKITKEVLDSVEELVEILEAQKVETEDVSEILKWLESKRKSYPVKIEEIGIKDLDGWSIDSKTGNISHKSGKFFTVMGVRITGATDREVTSWSQPMIKQQETGILGILCKKFNGVRRYLLYAKFEPGNMFKLQLSPTLQATDSNLKLAHGGKKPLFSEYFEEGGKGKVLLSVVGIDDGGRFYLKTNKCMIVEVDESEDVKVPDGFIWLTLPQIKKLIKMECVVNSFTRMIIGSK
jgi:oxidase EvaA